MYSLRTVIEDVYWLCTMAVHVVVLVSLHLLYARVLREARSRGPVVYEHVLGRVGKLWQGVVRWTCAPLSTRDDVWAAR